MCIQMYMDGNRKTVDITVKYNAFIDVLINGLNGVLNILKFIVYWEI